MGILNFYSSLSIVNIGSTIHWNYLQSSIVLKLGKNSFAISIFILYFHLGCWFFLQIFLLKVLKVWPEEEVYRR